MPAECLSFSNFPPSFLARGWCLKLHLPSPEPKNMSKAFTREPDQDTPDLPSRPLRAPLPPGVKNYVTAEGWDSFQKELNALIQSERPSASQLTDKLERDSRLMKIDFRIRQIQEILQSAVRVDPP